MYLILNTHMISEYHRVGSCVVEFSVKTVKSWLAKINLAKKLGKQNKSFRRMEFYEITNWIGKITDDQEQKVLAKIPLNEYEYVDGCRDEYTVVAVEVDRIEVDDMSIMFSAYLGDTELRVESAPLYNEELKGMLNALTCSKKKVPLLLNTTQSSIIKSILMLRVKGEI